MPLSELLRAVPAGYRALGTKPGRHRDRPPAHRRASAPWPTDPVSVTFPEEITPVLTDPTSPVPDPTSPVPVLTFVTYVRAAHRRAPSAVLTPSELLPDPRSSWPPDAEGRRYVSYPRLQLTRDEKAPAPGVGSDPREEPRCPRS